MTTKKSNETVKLIYSILRPGCKTKLKNSH